MKEKPAILFRCDGASDIGLGHIVRCLALADELKKRNFGVCFAMRKGPLGIKMVEEKGYKVILSDESCIEFNGGVWLKQCVSKTNPRAIIFDVRDNLSKEIVKEIKDGGVLIVTIDDPEDKRLEADLAFYPPVPQVKRVDWSSFSGELYTGWDWVIIRPEFAAWREKHNSIAPMPTNNHQSQLRILVTMGGSDPANLTLKAVKALNMLSTDFKATVILGPGYVYKDSLKTFLQEVHYEYTILENVRDMVSIMAQADLAIASFGVTAYELAVMGVPAVYMCLTADHAESARAFAAAGMALTLGQYGNGNIQETASKIKELFKQTTLHEMSHKAKLHMDGLGTIRISNLLRERLNVSQ